MAVVRQLILGASCCVRIDVFLQLREQLFFQLEVGFEAVYLICFFSGEFGVQHHGMPRLQSRAAASEHIQQYRTYQYSKG